MRVNVSNGDIQIVGIVSMMVREGCTSVVPNVYVRVSKYLPWIKKNMENFEDSYIYIHANPTYPKIPTIEVVIMLDILLFIVIICIVLWMLWECCCNN